MGKQYTIGTRGSLLALTQSTMIKQQLETLTGETFNLKVIETQGDQITSVPLWQLEGKDFFTKELDAALLKGEIDLDIHSYKDLGSERPAGIMLAAITKRQFAHDLLLIKRETVEQLPQMEQLVVGTSSPRRIFNIEKHLANYLPNQKIEVATKVLRGNINTRIRKLQNGDYHAIILALAGVERLASFRDSQDEIAELLAGLTFMVLPQSVFTSAAAQGALGIECLEQRDDGGKLKEILVQLRDQTTMREMKIERELFASYGGGCHLAVGINALEKNDHLIVQQNGTVDGQEIGKKEIVGINYHLPAGKKIFIGLPSQSENSADGQLFYDQLIDKVPVACSESLAGKNIYLTSKHCLLALKKGGTPSTLWSAGTKSWQRSAQANFWVHGTADSLGEDGIAALVESNALNLMEPLKQSQWAVLTNQSGDSALGEVVTAYQRECTTLNQEQLTNLGEIEIFYWTSFFQYQTYLSLVPAIKERCHCCGFGKSFSQFKNAGVEVTPFISITEFKKTVNL
ncbi:MAG: hydroxymethylbilane synthase [Bdellovibrionales bacterium]|nr:hydroxymethylbilane synthase [Bdellovibrionales bacterium]MBT3526658.1 hydroxymethylbilane synthase [Bdellovibrionales bacterium]MBT7669309.1 hydroxymethylbilane synthase [Bdellovibrionales bacterium]MBT7766406.1 hydroxymethylbilane synthase [Bdellovibrionales bacterium]